MRTSMTHCDFLSYADYYAYIAKSGLDCATSLYGAIEAVARIDTSTFDLFEDAQSAFGDVNYIMRNSYEIVFSNVYQTASMTNSFVALAEYIKRTSGQSSIDAFLNEYGLQVLPAYASLSNVFGDPISTGNIRDY